MRIAIAVCAVLCLVGSLRSADARTLFYGRHLPNGQAGHDAIKGANGTWRSASGIQYTVNYYSYNAHTGHSHDRPALIDQAQTQGLPRTARDANGHLLFDSDNNLAIDSGAGGDAFCEHWGMGVDESGACLQRTSPFKQFWFDDNWCAREMCKAYGSAQPNGLHMPPGFIRWSPLDGGTSRFTPYNDAYVDRRCLDGLYRLGQDNTPAALVKWNEVKDVAPVENYHVGLQLCLGGQLLNDPAVSSSDRHAILQRWVELRRILLTRQTPCGTWRSSNDSIHDLVNTETVALASIGLAADAFRVYEAGVAPMQANAGKGYSYTSGGRYIEAERNDQSGHLVYGPYQDIVGTSAQFAIRCYGANANVAEVEVCNAAGVVTASQTVTPAMVSGSDWKLVTAPFGGYAYEVRVWFHTNSCDRLQVAFVRIR
ncbi:MAG: hypothetical protein ACRCT8_12225 [Lacipirellulaceae bacterium]